MYSYGKDFYDEVDIDDLIREYVKGCKEKRGQMTTGYRKGTEDPYDLVSECEFSVYRNQNEDQICAEAQVGFLPVEEHKTANGEEFA